MINSLLLVSLLFIGYNAMKQKEIFPFSDISKKEIRTIIKEEKKQEKIKKREVNFEEQEVYEKLLVVMQNDKPFLNSELSLFSLASTLKISAHALSFIINECSGENFNQFVNGYRIEEAKKLIVNPKMNHLNIMGIGYEVGFNSKSTFITTFKKITNQTPSEYKKSNSTTLLGVEL
ncbi:MAG: AraC family transcriptional regulator [Flavobacterium sp.]|uniref:helix-turn-helix domain-containing protein n=1 Tax=Flavobacterium sp. TaxID=239 RepID=UPI0022C4286D|nr:AraC family transcriptional regulator [Flavobacterium sp.]MCZ8197882.1 AraC family transcriptional regulator [Flavobacterium sp.]